MSNNKKSLNYDKNTLLSVKRLVSDNIQLMNRNNKLNKFANSFSFKIFSCKQNKIIISGSSKDLINEVSECLNIPFNAKFPHSHLFSFDESLNKLAKSYKDNYSDDDPDFFVVLKNKENE